MRLESSTGITTRGQWPFRPAATRAMKNRQVMLYDLNYCCHCCFSTQFHKIFQESEPALFLRLTFYHPLTCVASPQVKNCQRFTESRSGPTRSDSEMLLFLLTLSKNNATNLFMRMHLILSRFILIALPALCTELGIGA